MIAAAGAGRKCYLMTAHYTGGKYSTGDCFRIVGLPEDRWFEVYVYRLKLEGLRLGEGVRLGNALYTLYVPFMYALCTE